MKLSLNKIFIIFFILSLSIYGQDSPIQSDSNRSSICKNEILKEEKISSREIKKNIQHDIISIEYLLKKSIDSVYKSGTIKDKNLKIDILQNSKSRTQFYKKSEFVWLTAGMIVIGGISILCKIEADMNYDKFKISNNNDYMDKVKILDRVSGISLGLLQLNIGYLVYRLLSD